MTPITFTVMTKDEPEAFRLLEILHLQLRRHHHILILDDFSNESYYRHLASFADYWRPNCLLYRHALNQHFSQHRNYVKGLVPHGEWIVMLDADEVVMPGFVEGVSKTLRENPEADALFFQRSNSFYDPPEDSTPPVPDFTKPFPGGDDFQPRGFLNVPNIYYVKPRDNELQGYKHEVWLKGPPFCLLHRVRNGKRRYDYWI